jgi:hypothetical protein
VARELLLESLPEIERNQLAGDLDPLALLNRAALIYRRAKSLWSGRALVEHGKIISFGSVMRRCQERP